MKNFSAKLIEENKSGKVKSELAANLVRVEVFLRHLNYYTVSESPSYDMTDLLSDFGGNIGLWLGWSALTLFELFDLIRKLLGLYRNNDRDKNTSGQNKASAHNTNATSSTMKISSSV